MKIENTPRPEGSVLAILVDGLLVTVEASLDCEERFFWQIVAGDRTGGTTHEWESEKVFLSPEAAMAAGMLKAEQIVNEENAAVLRAEASVTAAEERWYALHDGWVGEH